MTSEMDDYCYDDDDEAGGGSSTDNSFDNNEKCIKDTINGSYRPSFPFNQLPNGAILALHNTDAFTIAPGQQITPTHENTSFSLLQQVMPQIINYTQLCVGRVFTNDGKGSGFRVAPTVIASAEHVFAGGDPYFNTTINAASIELARQSGYGSSVTPLIPQAVRKSLLQKDKELGAYDADPGQIGTQRRTTHTQNDFSLGEVFSTKEYLFPYCEPVIPNMPIALLGYPGRPSIKHQENNYYTHHKISPSKISQTFNHCFGVKHLACGVVQHVDEVFGRVFTTTSTCLPGSSGGPIVPLVDPTSFCGIHIGGWEDGNYNGSVSVHHPNFVVMYAKFVVPTLPAPVHEKVVKYLRMHANVLLVDKSIPSSVLCLL